MSKQKNEDEISFPYEITKIDNSAYDCMKLFKGFKYFVKVGPEEWFFPCKYQENAQNYYNFKIRPDDVFIMTFPRSGTTMTLELVWLLLKNLNFEKAKEKLLYERVLYLDSQLVVGDSFEKFASQSKDDLVQTLYEATIYPLKLLEEMKERRAIKTHLPFCLLPPDILTCGAKVIYVARNPRDVIASFYHLQSSFLSEEFQGNFEQYYDCFQNSHVTYTPYWSHIKQGWEKRNHKNVCFIFYEDYLKDLRSSIKKIAEFLEKPLSDLELDSLENHLTFENFKRNESINPIETFKKCGFMRKKEDSNFVRQGKTGGSKSLFTEKLNQKASIWINENMKKINISFPE